MRLLNHVGRAVLQVSEGTGLVVSEVEGIGRLEQRCAAGGVQ